MDSIQLIMFCKGADKIQRLIESTQMLKIPEQHKLEVLFVQGNSLAAAYQDGLQKTNARYKIYLKDSARILNPNILLDVLKIFESDRDIGMIGCLGSERIPTNGVSQISPRRFGKVVVGNQTLNFGSIDGLCREVMAIDDVFIATQYDIPWRSDLFKQEGFVAPSQSIEFKRKHYKVVVASQQSPWVQFDNINTAFDERERNVFLDEYSKDIFPLVSIIIPTFQRPHFFKIALESVINQTYRNLDIFITDNSHNDETAKLMQPYLAKDKRITYEWHDEFDAGDNWTNARRHLHPDAEYINWLMDDDVFMLDKIEKM
ncbi:MAG: glycosyltransferase, partial [Selenomonadaceae bacterium]|nr:glycosyltransferase [Selenomonadaceae bacterium]